MMVDSLDDLLFFHINWKLFSELCDLFWTFDLAASLREWQIWMGDVFQTVWLILIFRKLNGLLCFLDDP